MGAPESGMRAVDRPTAEELLTTLRTIKAAERAKHAVVLDYWLSIRGDKEFPPLHDLDPLEISDAGPCSILLELVGGGQDAEIRHIGDALSQDVGIKRIIDAPNPSILSCIAKKLPIVAISRDFLAFEDSFDSAGGWTRLWVTLLPLSSCGSWVDYVYAFVSVETGGGKAAKPTAKEVEAVPVEEAATAELQAEAEQLASDPEPAADVVPFAAVEPAEPVEEAVEDVAEPVAEVPPEVPAEESEAADDVVPFVAEDVSAAPEEAEEPADAIDPVEEVEQMEPVEAVHEPEPEQVVEESTPSSGPGFSRILEGLAQLTGFYGQGVKVEDPVVQMEPPVGEPTPPEPAATEPNATVPEAIEVEALEPPVEPEEPSPERAVAEAIAEQELVAEAPEELVPEDAATDREPDAEAAAAQPQPPVPAMEGTLQSKLTEVQAKANEAREAQLRATQALHQGLSAAYDFALDAESSPEEYLRMVEAQGLKIQLRAPMAPVAKLAFDGVCDAATIRQFEAVLAWALKVELPRGALLERIEQAGGIPELLNEFAKAA